MPSMNISLPDPLKEFIDQQVAEGRYSSVSEYVRELVRADEKRKAEDRLEAMLLEGLRSDDAAFSRDDWAALREEARARLARKKG